LSGSEKIEKKRVSMDSYLSYDSEELYWRYGVILGSSGLSGIVGIYELAKAGCVEDVLECLRCGGNKDYALSGACRSGRIDLVKLMIEKIESGLDWNKALWNACREGHYELVWFMTQKIGSSGTFNWNYGLYGACRGSHCNLIELMIQKGAYTCWCGKPLEEHLV
jgi:hypothetical protein